MLVQFLTNGCDYALDGFLTALKSSLFFVSDYMVQDHILLHTICSKITIAKQKNDLKQYLYKGKNRKTCRIQKRI